MLGEDVDICSPGSKFAQIRVTFVGLAGSRIVFFVSSWLVTDALGFGQFAPEAASIDMIGTTILLFKAGEC